jgi:hypothetical protein
MNGFRVLAVGAFLYCGPSFCQAQINILENQAHPRSVLVRAAQEDFSQTADSANLTRSQNVDAEISSNAIDDPFPGANPSPSDTLVDANVDPAPDSDPASLPVGIRHRHNPIDQILRNGLISQTPNAAQAPVSWPMQGVDNPTARMLLNTGCTQGLWDNYPAERAAECALMYQRLAGNQRAHGCGCQSCGAQGCGTSCKTCRQTGRGNAHFHPTNRYAPASCDARTTPASHAAAKSQPQFESLLAPIPVVNTPIASESKSEVPENQDNVAQLPGLFR